jgi:GT2 family glycosyltransferase
MTESKNVQARLSIIVVAWNGSLLLRECLSSIRNQNDVSDREVIVVSNFEMGISEIETEFPFARFFTFPKETTVPQLRAFGINRANGAIIALVEDFCRLESKWVGEIKKAHELSYSVVGGAVENANDLKALDWAVYFSDYGRYMLPVHAGVTDSLSGANVSYRKEILDLIREKYEDGFYETFIHEEINNLGYELYFTPSAVVYHNKTYNFKKTVVQFFHQARSFAAQRVFRSSVSKRLLYSAASLILPVLLPARIILQTASKKRNFKKLIISLPFIAILTSVWAVGEFCGYLAGKGKSEHYWK